MTDQQLVEIAAAEVWSFVKKGSVVWIGSGPSAGLYPDWPRTVIELCEQCGIAKLDTNIRHAAALIDKAEECKRVNSDKYHKTLARLFGGTPVGHRAAYGFLAKLPFTSYVTTNVDPLLHLASARKSELFIYPNLRADKLAKKRDATVFYMHGLARVDNRACGTNLVFSRSEFEKAYSQSYLGSFLIQLLGFHRILFVGCRLSESYIEEVFSRIRTIHSQPQLQNMQQPERCILLPFEEHYEEARFNELGINIIRYPPADDLHIGLEQVLEAVCGLAKVPGYVSAGEALPDE